MDYTNKDEVKDYLGKTLDASYDAKINRWISAISRYIDKETNHFPLVVDTSATDTRKYDGKGGQDLIIDNITLDNIEHVKVAGSEITGFEVDSNYGDGGYILYSTSGFPRGERNVEVKGKFGKYEQVPGDISFACAVLVAGIINTSLSEGNETRSETIGRYSVTYSAKSEMNDFKMAKQIIQDFRKINIL